MPVPSILICNGLVGSHWKTGAVHFEWIPTNDMAADGLTNALSNDEFAVFVSQLGRRKDVGI